MPVAAASASSSASSSGGLTDLFAAAGPGGVKSSQDNVFQDLLSLLAGLQSGQKLSVADLQNLSNLAGADPGALSVTGGPVVPVSAKDKNSQNDSGDAQAGNLTAEQISMLAFLLQQNPQLQVLFSGNLDLKSMSAVVDVLAKGGQPDWSQYHLPQGAQNLLSQMASQPGQLGAIQKLLADMQNNTTADNELQDLSDLAKQLVANAAPAQNQAQLAATQPVTVVNVANATNANTKQQPLSNERAVLANADLSLHNKILQPNSTANAQHHNTPTEDDSADQSSDAEKMAPAAQSQPASGSFTAAAEKSISSPVSDLGTDISALAANNPANLAAQLNSTVNALQANPAPIINTNAAQAYNALQTASAAPPAAVMQAAIQIQQNMQTNNSNFIIQLYPESLGQIQVNLKFEGNRVTAKISADKQETLDLMKQDSGVLNKALQEAGLQTDSGTLEFSLSNGAQNMAQQKNSNGNGEFGTMLANSDAMENNTLTAVQTGYVSLAPGRVDVKL